MSDIAAYFTVEEIRGYLSYAYLLASASKDPSTQNGAVLVHREGRILARGINEFPRGVEETSERYERPLKYQVIEHAERNAILQAAREGLRVDGTFLFCPWAACADCARAIIQSGVQGLIRHKNASDRSPDSWKQSIEIADTMLEEAGVRILDYEGALDVGGDHFRVLHSGNLWRP